MAGKKIDNEKISSYIRRHDFARRWISVVIVLALLVAGVTIYALNRNASALTEDDSDEVGLVLDSAEGDAENGEDAPIEEAAQEEDADEEADQEEPAEDDASSEEADTSNDADETDAEDNEDQAEDSEDAETADDGEGSGEEDQESENGAPEGAAEDTASETPAEEDAEDALPSDEENPEDIPADAVNTNNSVQGMIVTGVSLFKNPDSDGRGGYSGGTPINDGDEVYEGDTLYFLLDYRLEPGTLSDDNTKVTYNLSDNNIKVKESITDSIYNSDNAAVGTFSVDKDTGMVTFDFYAAYVEKNKTFAIDDCSFYFMAMAELDGDGDSEDVSYSFGDYIVNLKIVKPQKHDLSVVKTVHEYNSDDRTLTYTIEVSSVSGTDGDIELEDEFYVQNHVWRNSEQNKELTAQLSVSSFDIKKNGEDFTADPSYKDNTFSLNLPALSAGEKYDITYKLNVPEGITTDIEKIIKNKVNATAGDDRKTAECERSFSGEYPMIRKSGEVRNGRVYWTVVINEKHNNLRGFTFGDQIWKNGNVKVPLNEYVRMERDTVDGKTYSVRGWNFVDGKYTFPDEDDYDQYRLYYDYAYGPDDIVNGNLVNEAYIRLNPDDRQSGNDHTKYIGVGSYKYVEKKSESISADSDKAGWVNIDWNITFTAPIVRNEGGGQYWIFTDEMKDASQIMTDDQVNALIASMKSALASVGCEAEVELDKDASLTRTVEGQTGYYKLTLRIYGDLDKTISYSYSTAGYVGDYLHDQRFFNDATVNGYTNGDNIATGTMNVVKMDGRGNTGNTRYDYYSDELFGEGILTWRIACDLPNNMTEDYVITDTLPDNLRLLDTSEGEEHGGERLYGIDISVYDSFPANGTIRATSDEAKGYGVSCSTNGNIIKLTIDPQKINPLIPNGNSKLTFYVRVRAQIKDDLDFEATPEAVFENSVSVGTGSDENIKTDSQTQSVTKVGNTISKKGAFGPDGTINTVEYSIDVNPDALDLLPGGDTLKLTDTLKAGSDRNVTVSLLPDSVKVYEYTSEGDEPVLLSQDMYSYRTNMRENTEDHTFESEIVFSIPDRKHLLVTYRYTFGGDAGANVNVTNNAVLEGISSASDHASDSMRFALQNAGARANIRGIDIYKVDKDNNGLTLEGAQFRLYIYEDNEWKEINELEGHAINLVTAQDGRIYLSPLKYNNAYMLEEIQAPDGYLLNREPLLFYVRSSDVSKYPMNLPADFYDRFGMAYDPGAKVYFTNENQKTSIRLTKNWENADETQPQQVLFKLRRRYQVNESADGEGSESPGDIEDTGFERDVYLYADSDWTVMLTDLDRYREDGDNRYEYYYYISEPDIMYYETDPEKSNMGPVNSGELWVTNRRNEVEQYSLPATGGRGRLPFTIAGLILATAAIIGEEQYRKRRRGR